MGPNLFGPADTGHGISAGFALERCGATLPYRHVARFRVGAHRRWNQDFHRVYQVPIVVIANLATVVTGVLRSDVLNLQRVAFQQFEAHVPGDDEVGCRYYGTPSAPQQDVVAWNVTGK